MMMSSDDPEPRRPRILAIEDDPAIRRLYQRLFDLHDYDLVLAPSGTAAMETLRGDRGFDVILMDIRLPGVSGRALWKWMELEHPELCRRVILVSGDILGESTQNLIDETGRPFLDKPFSTPELLQLIEAVRTSAHNDPNQDRCVGE